MRLVAEGPRGPPGPRSPRPQPHHRHPPLLALQLATQCHMDLTRSNQNSLPSKVEVLNINQTVLSPLKSWILKTFFSVYCCDFFNRICRNWSTFNIHSSTNWLLSTITMYSSIVFMGFCFHIFTEQPFFILLWFQLDFVKFFLTFCKRLLHSYLVCQSYLKLFSYVSFNLNHRLSCNKNMLKLNTSLLLKSRSYITSLSNLRNKSHAVYTFHQTSM